MSILLNSAPKKGIVKNGLILNLDGRDFQNKPSTTTWKDRGPGSSYQYSNMCTNGDFSLDTNADGIADGIGISTSTANNLSVSNNTQSFTPTAIYGGIAFQMSFVQNHVYYASVKVNSTHIITVQFNDAPTYSASHNSGVASFQRITLRYVKTSANAAGALNIQDNNTSGFVPVQVQQLLILDLTTIFGAGNEPTQAWCDANLGSVSATGRTIKGNDAIPSNFSYTSSSGSDNRGGVVFDGVDDKITIPNSGSFISMYKNGVAITPRDTISDAGTVKSILAYNRTLTQSEIVQNYIAVQKR